MNIQEYITNYVGTLQINPTNQETYIKIPITDLKELGYMQQSLLENLQLLTQLEDHCETDRTLKGCIYWLSKILLASYPEEELEGMSQLIESTSKLT